jgi:hypothetical protein
MLDQHEIPGGAMAFQHFVPDCAQFILRREQKELPGDVIAEMAIDEGLYESHGQGQEGKIRSLLGTLHSEVTRGQPGRPSPQHIFYRTEKKPHPHSGRIVHYFGLVEWKRGVNGRAVRHAPSEAASELRVTVELDPELQTSVNLLLASGKVSSEADGVLWLAREGQKERKGYLSDLQQALDLLQNVRDGV